MRVQFNSAAPICLARLKPLQMQTCLKSSAAHLLPYVSATTIANTIIVIIIIMTNTIILINISATVTTITTTATVATVAITTTRIPITTISIAATLIALPHNEMQRRII